MKKHFKLYTQFSFKHTLTLLIVVNSIFTYAQKTGIKVNNPTLDKIYSLENGETFKKGGIGTDKEGNITYTWLTLKHENIDSIYYLILNGEKFGPFDEAFGLTPTRRKAEPDLVFSNGGNCINFVGVKGNGYRTFINGKQIASSENRPQVPTFTIASDNSTVLYSLKNKDKKKVVWENYKETGKAYQMFLKPQFSDNNNSHLYIAAFEPFKHFLAVNHKNVSANYTGASKAGFIPGTEKYYFVGYNENNEQILVIDNEKKNFGRYENIESIKTSRNNILILFTKLENRKHKYFIIRYNIRNKNMDTLGPYEKADISSFNSSNPYFAVKWFGESWYIRSEDGDSLFNLNKKAQKIYITKKKNDFFVSSISSNAKVNFLYKNGKQVNDISLDYLKVKYDRDNNVLVSGIKPLENDSHEFRTYYKGNKVTLKLNDKYSKAYPNPDKGTPYILTRVSDKEEYQLYLGKEKLGKTWQGLDKYTFVVSHSGKSYAFLFNGSSEKYFNDYMIPEKFISWKLVVNGNILDGKYSAPVWSKAHKGLVAIKQIKREFKIVRID